MVDEESGKKRGAEGIKKYNPEANAVAHIVQNYAESAVTKQKFKITWRQDLF